MRDVLKCLSVLVDREYGMFIEYLEYWLIAGMTFLTKDVLLVVWNMPKTLHELISRATIV